jgi:hypothetical protein
LGDKKVSANITVKGLILVFSYSKNKLAASKLTIPEGHKINPNILKANIMCTSNLAPGLDFLAINNSSSRFHLKTP